MTNKKVLQTTRAFTVCLQDFFRFKKISILDGITLNSTPQKVFKIYLFLFPNR